MKAPRAGLVAAGCLLAGVLLAMPQGIHGQAGGFGQAGPGHGPNGAPGRATPAPVDPGRPWGWAVRAFMDDPAQPLYNTTKQKMLDGQQVFSQTITSFDVKAYCDGAAKFEFSRFEQRAVDVGALGIIVPTVDDAIESRSVAMFARFPPIARRPSTTTCSSSS